MASKIPKIPKRLIVGFRNMGVNKIQAFPTEIRLSNRTKNSAFKINNEASWKNKISVKIPKIKVTNELRDGFSIPHQEILSFSRSGSRAVYYLYHEIFQGHIMLSPENFFQLLQECNIDKGVIKEKLIFDGKHFITEEVMKENLKEDKDKDQSFVELKESMKIRKVPKKDLVVGKIYQLTPTKKRPEWKGYTCYLGTVRDTDGNILHMLKDYSYEVNYNRFVKGPRREVRNGSGNLLSLPDLIGSSYNSRGQYNSGYSSSQSVGHKYKGVDIRPSSYDRVSYRKGLPALYKPEDTTIESANVFQGYDQEDVNLIKYLLIKNKYFDIQSYIIPDTIPQEPEKEQV